MDLMLFELKNVFLPEVILLIFIIGNILISLFLGKRLYKLSGRIAIASVILPLIVISTGIIHSGYTAFSECYIQTNFTMVMKVLILMGTFFTVLLSKNIFNRLRYRAFEYFNILMTAALSAMILVSSNDFIPMIISASTLLLSCVVLIAFWNRYTSKESAVKYLINAVVALAFLLFGISILYGMSGELNFTLLNLYYYGQDSSLLFILASVFIICGLMYLTNCMPFHRITPDVFEGSPYPVNAFLSFVPPVAGFAVLTRLIAYIMPEMPFLQLIISVIAVFTIAYGTFGAFRQTNLKRFLGYTAVLQSGFMLLALSIFSNYGVSAFVYYAIIYLFVNFGLWAAGLTFVSCTGSDEIKDYKGLFYLRPYYATAFVICLMAVAGLPPTAGFLSKLYLFCSVMRLDMSGLPVLCVVLLLTAVGVFTCVNIIRILFEKNKEDEIFISPQLNMKSVLYFCTFVLILISLFSNQIIWLSMFAAVGI